MSRMCERANDSQSEQCALGGACRVCSVLIQYASHCVRYASRALFAGAFENARLAPRVCYVFACVYVIDDGPRWRTMERL